MPSVAARSVAGAARQLSTGQLTSLDLVDESLENIERYNPPTNAFITVHADTARDQARQADDERRRGLDRGPLHGIPISLKDLIDVRGQVTTAASKAIADRVANVDATVVTRLRDAGAVIIGRTNLHEFALGTTSEDSAFGPVRHPMDPKRSPGGSSGGSAVAVTTGMGLASIGTDTGGSVRIPAAACGIVGLKPTFGEIPTDGVIPLSPSFDHVGPLAQTVEDAALLWAILSGRRANGLEPVSLDRLRIAVLDGVFAAPVEPVVRTAFDAAVDRLRQSRVALSSRSLPSESQILEAYVNVVLPEGAAWHAPLLATRPGDYSPTVRARLESGALIPAVAYVAAQQFRQRLTVEVDRALEGVDVLALPTLPIVAPRLGAGDITIDPATGDRTPVRTAMLRQTQPFNMTGHPAISLPVAAEGLPVGLQLVGRHGETARLLAIAAACEKMVS